MAPLQPQPNTSAQPFSSNPDNIQWKKDDIEKLLKDKGKVFNNQL
jgi:hypothetical protein